MYRNYIYKFQKVVTINIILSMHALYSKKKKNNNVTHPIKPE